YRELEEKLDYLQKSSAQRDRTEALLKLKDKECAQVCYRAFKISRLHLQRSTVLKYPVLGCLYPRKVKALQAAERELDQQRKQHHVAMDKLLLQVQSLESALKMERHGGDLSSRLEEAERALAIKQDLIDKLKEEVEQQKGSLETVPVLTAQ
ncbi:hypothetical protein GOODEAATRI_029999, partial [Goodea atripinnis]